MLHPRLLDSREDVPGQGKSGGELCPHNPLLPDWDEIVSRRSEATVFHTSAWTRVLKDTYGYQPLYFATDEAQPALLCSFEVDSWLTGRRGISLPFTDECQFLSSPGCSSERLFEQATYLGRERRWRSFELRGADNSEHASLSFFTHTLELARGTDELFASFDSSIRRAIRKAERSKLSIQIEDKSESAQTYYQLHCLTRRKHGLPPQPFRFFESIQRHLIAAGRGFVVVARLENTPVAAALFVHHGARVHYKFGASDQQFEELRPNNLVMWSAIKHCVSNGFRWLDFGRTSLHAAGLRKYKQHWGTRESQLHYRKWDFRRHCFVQDTDRSSGLKNHIFRFLPSSVNRILGQLLYPHIA